MTGYTKLMGTIYTQLSVECAIVALMFWNSDLHINTCSVDLVVQFCVLQFKQSHGWHSWPPDLCRAKLSRSDHKLLFAQFSTLSVHSLNSLLVRHTDQWFLDKSRTRSNNLVTLIKSTALLRGHIILEL